MVERPHRRCEHYNSTGHCAQRVAIEHCINWQRRFQHRAPLFVTPCFGIRHHIEHNKRVATETVPAFKSFAIRSRETAIREFDQCTERGPETIRDSQQRTMSISHRSG